jgi:hypothetical protein
MFLRCLVFLLCLSLFACKRQTVGLDASKIKWSSLGHGYLKDVPVKDVPDITFSLLASGFFRAPRRDDTEQLIDHWMKTHPKAIAIPVTTLKPFNERNPNSKFVFVWIVEGSSNLNVELVREGCFPPGTQVLFKGEKLEVLQADYDNFLSQIESAGHYAEQHKLGVWAGEYGKGEWLRPDTDND